MKHIPVLPVLSHRLETFILPRETTISEECANVSLPFRRTLRAAEATLIRHRRKIVKPGPVGKKVESILVRHKKSAVCASACVCMPITSLHAEKRGLPSTMRRSRKIVLCLSWLPAAAAPKCFAYFRRQGKIPRYIIYNKIYKPARPTVAYFPARFFFLLLPLPILYER